MKIKICIDLELKFFFKLFVIIKIFRFLKIKIISGTKFKKLILEHYKFY